MAKIYDISEGVYSEYDEEELRDWLNDYFDTEVRKVVFDNKVLYFYGHSRGYYRISNRLSKIKLQHFNLGEYVLLEEILDKLKISKSRMMSGGLFLLYKESRLQKNTFYKSRKKLVDLEILYETPFKNFYVINPDYIIKILIGDKLRREMEKKNYIRVMVDNRFGGESEKSE